MNRSIPNALTRLNAAVTRAVSFGTLAMVLVTFAVVVLRYVFGVGFIWMQEAVLYLHSMVFLLAVGATLDNGGHVRVDIFYRDSSPRRQALTDLIGSVLLLLPVGGLVLWQSLPYVLDAWAVRESSPEPGGLPGVYLVKSLLIAYPLLLCTAGLRLILTSTATLRKGSSQ